MGQDGEHFTVVDVIAGGPADQAGIKPGDTILAIDGTATSKLVLRDVRESIRRATVGRRMTLILESGGRFAPQPSRCETWCEGTARTRRPWNDRPRHEIAIRPRLKNSARRKFFS